MSYQKFGYTQELFQAMCPNYTDRCMCASCGDFFNSTAAFDMHRVGGKCLDPDKMKEKGMVRKASGHWITREMDSEAAGRVIERRTTVTPHTPIDKTATGE